MAEDLIYKADGISLKPLTFPSVEVDTEQIVSTGTLKITPGNCQVAINKASNFFNYALQIKGCENGPDSNLMLFFDKDDNLRSGFYLKNNLDLVLSTTATGDSMVVDGTTGLVEFPDKIKTPEITVTNIVSKAGDAMSIKPSLGILGINTDADLSYGLALEGGMKFTDALGLTFDNVEPAVLNYYRDKTVDLDIQNVAIAPVTDAGRFIRTGRQVTFSWKGFDALGSLSVTATGVDIFVPGTEDLSAFWPVANTYFPLVDLLQPTTRRYIGFLTDGRIVLYADIAGGNFVDFTSPNTFKLPNQTFTYLV